jgi:hypothetical protein
MKRYTSIALLAAVLCLLTSACITGPDGKKKLDPVAAGRIAGRAAYIGAKAELIKNPGSRPAFETAVAALTIMELGGVNDPSALADAMRSLHVREFRDPGTGALIVEAAVEIWDEVMMLSTPLDRSEYVKEAVPKIRAGLEQALLAVPETK